MGVQIVEVLNFNTSQTQDLARATSFARAKLYERANNCSGKFQTHNHCATRLARAKLYSCSKYGAKFTGMVNVIDLLPVEGIVSFELKS